MARIKTSDNLRDDFPNIGEADIVLKINTKKGAELYWDDNNCWFSSINDATPFRSRSSLLGTLDELQTCPEDTEFDSKFAEDELNMHTLDLCCRTIKVKSLDIKETALAAALRSQILKKMDLLSAKALDLESLLVIEKLSRVTDDR